MNRLGITLELVTINEVLELLNREDELGPPDELENWLDEVCSKDEDPGIELELLRIDELLELLN